VNAHKALELLKYRHAEDVAHAKADLYKADQISIEALELNLKMRETLCWPLTMRLPSEDPQ